MTFSYVELLRATRALRILAILLVLMLAGALIVRLSWGVPRYSNDIVRDYYAGLEHSPTAHVTRKRLPNGDTRTTVDDPKKEVYAIIDRRGSSVVAFTFAHTREAAEERRLHPNSGTRETTVGMVAGTATTTTTRTSTTTATTTTQGSLWTYPTLDLGMLFEMAVPMALLMATLLAGPLSKENNGHLDVAWTKPVSRERYAFAAVLVDVLTLLVAQTATALALVAAASFWGWPKFASGTPETPWLVALSVAAPIAWYAWLTALSASSKRGPGIALGMGWVVAIVVPWIATLTHDAATPVGRAVHAICDAASYLIPLSYIFGRVEVSDPARALAIGVGALAALSAVCLALALAQWRRLEA